jgi:hypothetical protein
MPHALPRPPLTTTTRHHPPTCNAQGASHGNTKHHRAPGSIGGRTDPGRVWKGKKMPGHMGAERVTFKNIWLYKVCVWLAGWGQVTCACAVCKLAFESSTCVRLKPARSACVTRVTPGSTSPRSTRTTQNTGGPVTQPAVCAGPGARPRRQPRPAARRVQVEVGGSPGELRWVGGLGWAG